MDVTVVLRDAQARITRALEALQDGESDLAVQLLDDLGHDLWQQVEREESGA